MTSCLIMRDVCKTFPGEEPRVVLRNVNVDIRPGDFAIITGPSGQGKSTLISIACGLLKPDSGSVELMSVDLSTASASELDRLRTFEMGHVFQNVRSFAALTARESLMFVAKRSLGRAAFSGADAALDEWGLVKQADLLPSQLSVGQQRRLSIARCLIMNPRLVFADEPTNDLDSRWSDYVIQKLADHAQKPGCAVVMVTHDVRYMDRGTRRFELLSGGELICDK